MIQLTIDESALKAISAQLDQLPKLVQASAFEGGLRPAANVVAARMRQLTPRSSRTGSTTKWSKKTKQKRASEKPLADTVAVKIIRSQDRNAIALIGFSWPTGNKGHFISPLLKDTREQVLWGRRTGKQVRKDNDFQRRAFDETRSQQAAAFTAGVTVAVTRKLRSLARG